MNTGAKMMEIEKKLLLLLVKIIIAILNVMERELQERIRNENSLDNNNNDQNFLWSS